MKCINFSIENQYNNFLKKIFENVNIEKYHWEIGYCEILCEKQDNFLDDTIFPSESLDGSIFQKCIDIEEYYMIFVDLKAFSSQNIKEIKIFEDFLNSDCEIAFFCTDSTSIEIFFKEAKVFETVVKNCRHYHFSDLEILTEEDHGRVDFQL